MLTPAVDKERGTIPRDEYVEMVGKPVSAPLQLLACHIAVCEGKDVGRIRNPAKSVTVEYFKFG